eukprot:superscaffoldBa00008454_g23362
MSKHLLVGGVTRVQRPAGDPGVAISTLPSECPQGGEQMYLLKLYLSHFTQVYMSMSTSPSLLRKYLSQGQLNEDNGSKLFTELLQDDDSSQQGQVFQSEDTCTDKL